MASLNRIEIIGNLGRDPEMRFTPNGSAVTTFTVAVNHRHKDSETVTWFTVKAWNSLAESCNTYLAKGRQVFVDGHLEIREYEDREGITRKTIEIIASHVIFLGASPGTINNPNPSLADEDNSPF